MPVRGVDVRIEKLNKSFGSNHVLKDIDLDIAPGETFSIIGPSGTGKSILLRHIIRLETPDSGQIYFNGQPVFHNGRAFAPNVSAAAWCFNPRPCSTR